MGVLAGIVLAGHILLSVFVSKPKPSEEYHFTTRETCPFYTDVYGNTQVEPFAICPDPEELELEREWAKCGDDCIPEDEEVTVQ